jgi:hypothetical protein
MLERMRLINQANLWSAGSHAIYQSGLRRLNHFEADFGVAILRATPLLRPPRSPSIGMMWAQQHYAIQTPARRHSQSSKQILFQTARTAGIVKLLIPLKLCATSNGAFCWATMWAQVTNLVTP